MLDGLVKHTRSEVTSISCCLATPSGASLRFLQLCPPRGPEHLQLYPVRPSRNFGILVSTVPIPACLFVAPVLIPAGPLVSPIYSGLTTSDVMGPGRGAVDRRRRTADVTSSDVSAVRDPDVLGAGRRRRRPASREECRPSGLCSR